MERARALGVVVRVRKVDIYALVWSLALGFQGATKRAIDSLRQVYQKEAGHSLVRSAFHDRLTGRLALLLKTLALACVETLAAGSGAPGGYLSNFRQLLALDASVLRLRDLLCTSYPACRTNHTQAAAKLHMVMNVVDGSPARLCISDERTNDRTPWRRVGKWLQGCLLLFDLGYYSFQLFDRIDRNDGFFISRLKKNANLLVVAENRRWRGRSIALVGRRLQDVLGSLKRDEIDVWIATANGTTARHFDKLIESGALGELPEPGPTSGLPWSCQEIFDLLLTPLGLALDTWPC